MHYLKHSELLKVIFPVTAMIMPKLRVYARYSSAKI
jgi:hypothetical protein